MRQKKRTVLDALGWRGYDWHTISINMLEKCMSAKLPLDVLLRTHFFPDGRARDIANGGAATPGSPAYELTFCVFVMSLIRLVRSHRGSLDLLVRGDTVRSPCEMLAVMEARQSGAT